MSAICILHSYLATGVTLIIHYSMDCHLALIDTCLRVFLLGFEDFLQLFLLSLMYLCYWERQEGAGLAICEDSFSPARATPPSSPSSSSGHPASADDTVPQSPLPADDRRDRALSNERRDSGRGK